MANLAETPRAPRTARRRLWPWLLGIVVLGLLGAVIVPSVTNGQGILPKHVPDAAELKNSGHTPMRRVPPGVAGRNEAVVPAHDMLQPVVVATAYRLLGSGMYDPGAEAPDSRTEAMARDQLLGYPGFKRAWEAGTLQAWMPPYEREHSRQLRLYTDGPTGRLVLVTYEPDRSDPEDGEDPLYLLPIATTGDSLAGDIRLDEFATASRQTDTGNRVLLRHKNADFVAWRAPAR